MAKIITFTINEDASVTADAQGFQGTGCAEAIAGMMRPLGGKKIDGGHKPEYHQCIVEHIKVGGA